MIAFDLDGVLIPDCNHISAVGDLHDFYVRIASNMIPVFVPQGDFCIITARNKRYRLLTRAWVDRYLLLPEDCLFHDCDTQTPSEYKASVLNTMPQVTHFVESDPYIVDKLRETVTTGCKIIHFSPFAAQMFTNLS
jgi:hypothetical protein